MGAWIMQIVARARLSSSIALCLLRDCVAWHPNRPRASKKPDVERNAKRQGSGCKTAGFPPLRVVFDAPSIPCHRGTARFHGKAPRLTEASGRRTARGCPNTVLTRGFLTVSCRRRRSGGAEFGAAFEAHCRRHAHLVVRRPAHSVVRWQAASGTLRPVDSVPHAVR